MGNRHAVAVTACSQSSAQTLDMQDKTTACRDCPQSNTSYLKHYAAAAQLHSMGMHPCTACSSSQKSTRGARSIARKQDLLETESAHTRWQQLLHARAKADYATHTANPYVCTTLDMANAHESAWTESNHELSKRFSTATAPHPLPKGDLCLTATPKQPIQAAFHFCNGLV